MDRDTPDDIAALCLHVGLNRYVYKSFTPVTPPGRAPAPQEPAPDAAAITARSCPSPAVTDPWAARSRDRWQALRSVLDAGKDARSGMGETHAGECSLPAGSVSLLPVGGGVGATTILATLGRILSLRHERVLLLDQARPTLLPFYFGATQPASGACRFMPPRGASEGPVYIVSPKEEAGGAGPEEATPDTFDQLVWRSVSELRDEVDRVLLDAWHGMTLAGREALSSAGACLVVLVPDLNSVVATRSLIEFFRRHEHAHGQANAPHFLINKFDPSVSLHADLHAWLADQLGDRLLPFTIRRGDEAAQALAEGVTVVEYRPNSGIADDLRALADWLTKTQPLHHAVHAGVG